MSDCSGKALSRPVALLSLEKDQETWPRHFRCVLHGIKSKKNSGRNHTAPTAGIISEGFLKCDDCEQNVCTVCLELVMKKMEKELGEEYVATDDWCRAVSYFLGVDVDEGCMLKRGVISGSKSHCCGVRRGINKETNKLVDSTDDDVGGDDSDSDSDDNRMNEPNLDIILSAAYDDIDSPLVPDSSSHSPSLDGARRLEHQALVFRLPTDCIGEVVEIVGLTQLGQGMAHSVVSTHRAKELSEEGISPIITLDFLGNGATVDRCFEEEITNPITFEREKIKVWLLEFPPTVDEKVTMGSCLFQDSTVVKRCVQMYHPAMMERARETGTDVILVLGRGLETTRPRKQKRGTKKKKKTNKRKKNTQTEHHYLLSALW
jgi:hypothetical protein